MVKLKELVEMEVERIEISKHPVQSQHLSGWAGDRHVVNQSFFPPMNLNKQAGKKQKQNKKGPGAETSPSLPF
jgi:hypothetical protein